MKVEINEVIVIFKNSRYNLPYSFLHLGTIFNLVKWFLKKSIWSLCFVKCIQIDLFVKSHLTTSSVAYVAERMGDVDCQFKDT